MKRFFVACIIVLVASVALVAAIEYDSGYMLLSYGQYTLESSIWVGMLAFIVLFVVVYSFFSLVRRVISRSTAFGQWFTGHGYRRSQQQTTKGLIAFIEGNWLSARRILAKAAEKSDTPLLNYIMAARASHVLNDDEQVRHFLKRAEQSTSGAGIAVGLTQAELQLRNGHYDQSLATLNRVRLNAGKHPYVLKLLKLAYVGLKDWPEVLLLLPLLRKHKVFSPKELDELELMASKESIIAAAKLKDSPKEELLQQWQSLSKGMVKNSELVACYAAQLIALGDMQQAEKLIRNQLRKDWHKELVALYGKVNGEDVNKQLGFAEGWLKEHANDAGLFLCLGRLSLRNSLWGKARDYFESSLKLEKSAEVCAELGRLLAHLGDHKKSNEHFQYGLMLATEGLPELPQPDKH